VTTKPYPALCRDCRWSEPEESSPWCLRCTNPVVNAADAWALSSARANRGTTCSEERNGGWFAPCGKRGKQWQAIEPEELK
jgi:hypothetical protein